MEREQVYWDDVEIGQDIPTSFSLTLDMTRMCLQVSGTQDYYKVHHDREFAKSQGVPDVFVNTGFLTAAIGRLLTDWIGLEGKLVKSRIEMRRMNLLGDIMTVKGKVTNKYIDNGNYFVDVDMWCETKGQGITTPCNATILLPRK